MGFGARKWEFGDGFDVFAVDEAGEDEDGEDDHEDGEVGAPAAGGGLHGGGVVTNELIGGNLRGLKKQEGEKEIDDQRSKRSEREREKGTDL